MAIAPERIDAILDRAAALLGEGARIEAVVQAVKQMEPGISVHGAHADSMAEEPFKVSGPAAIYLVDSRDHCTVVTGNLNAATGVIVGQRDDEED